MNKAKSISSFFTAQVTTPQTLIMKKSKLIVLCAIVFITTAIQTVQAQTKINGQVTTVTDKAVDGVNVLLLNRVDSTLVKEQLPTVPASLVLTTSNPENMLSTHHSLATRALSAKKLLLVLVK